ncbi:DUF805 domain-containing protein [Desulfovibrio sp. JC010]|uniref:DUF805 domain-containing protein n=1 Tax=Desulfovibrio sp. JC010 TaxID=2593641 RepID=UPI0013D70FF4|nr:DUF805 domain-containing protein [Desulfovibrio sp. JC010]NDV28089.1 DUF805 domain-containing protein [Desulfovibrio sp. JC010]
MNYYIEILKKFNDFSGKADRGEFGRFLLWHGGIICMLLFLGYAIDHAFAHKVINTLSGLFMLGTLLPCIALFVRRLNALGRDPKLVLAALIPVVGLAYLVFVCLKQD